MQGLKRYAEAVSGVFVLSIMCSLLWLAMIGGGSVREALADEPALEALDQVTFEGIEQLRGKLGLDDEALAALGLSDQTTRQVLATCRQWYEANRDALKLRHLQIVAKKAVLRETERRIRVGPRDQQVIDSLPQERQAVEQAKEQYDKYLSVSLAPAIDALLTPEQRSLRQVLAANAGGIMPYRMFALTDQQKQTIAKARQRYFYACRKAPDESARAEARQQLQSKLAEVLTSAQLVKISSWRQSAPEASKTIMVAVKEVLAVDKTASSPK